MAAGALALLTGCATNTMTGRTQMSLISDEAVSKQSLSYYSAMVGDYRKKEKVIDAGPVKERVERITNRLIAQAVLYRPAA
ncbi:MAG: M48 family peptidase, partial [Pseudomonas stutzeri]|nr:M48 family peptidase [Stutzerimonas stutzeri]